MKGLSTFADLFAGIGGFHLALTQCGLECVFASEIDQRTATIYETNHQFKPVGDITKIKAESVPDHDVLCGGFPCQSFSNAGNKAGIFDPRGELFFEIVRIAKVKQPKVILLENVPALLSKRNISMLKPIYDSLKEIGYQVKHIMLNSGRYGSPQARRRVYFVALRRQAGFLFNPVLPYHKPSYVRDIILDDVDVTPWLVDDDWIYYREREQPLQAKLVQIAYCKDNAQGRKLYSINGQGITMTLCGGSPGCQTGVYDVNGVIRNLHPDEAKLMMGFPRDFKISPGRIGLRQLANAVIPQMISLIFKQITHHHNGGRIT